ncbi:MAG TPA: ATP-binding protein [Thermoanaerobaculia bacterium]|nr:ATP-binding protein [Thermoanaerobaculia bacterium]
MTLRSKIITYFVILHLVMAAAAVFFLLHNRVLLFAVEAFFLISIMVSFRLVRALFVPLDLITTGTELMNERDFGSRFVPVGQPELDRLIEIYNGMTDRLREERLTAEEQHQLLGKIVQASPSGIVICDFDGNVDLMNPVASRLVTPELMSELRSVAAGESRLVPYQGGRRLKVWCAEFRDRGFPKKFYLIEELTEELRVSEKAAYEKLIRMMSHEVNNSVGAVRSLLESLLRYAPDVRQTDRVDFTDAVMVASSRMDALNRFMRDLADVVRIPPPHRTTVDVGSVVREIAALLRPELEERRIDLRIHVDGAAVIVADRSQFEQVVLNILRNAVEAIGSAGSIEVSVRDGELSVADTGTGVAEEVRAELFSPFFSTKRDGRGLGLTVVQEILTNHGFGYALGNRSAGGAEFRVTW